ncbi:MAG: class I SAM-dependent methyltransferase, partial [Chloroflexota bacterium]
VEQQQQALDEGQITEEEWFDIFNETFTRHYLAADNPRAQSGHGGDAVRYWNKRRTILEAIYKDGTFLDVGCANGHLIECLDQWLVNSGLAVHFEGVDISEGLLALAKQRLPHWEDRFHLGNALYWTPPRPYDFVYLSGLEYVPLGKQPAFIEHIMSTMVAPNGRFILNGGTEEREYRVAEARLRAWGYIPTGYCEKSHQDHAGLVRRLFWFDMG